MPKQQKHPIKTESIGVNQKGYSVCKKVYNILTFINHKPEVCYDEFEKALTRLDQVMVFLQKY